MTTTITVDADTHSQVIRLQSALNFSATSGERYTLSDTVSYAVTNCLNGVPFALVQQPAAQMAYTATAYNTGVSFNSSPTCSPMWGTGTTTSSVSERLSLRRDK